MKQFNPKKIESKWQKIWARENTYKTSLKALGLARSKNRYVLDMFPYPSGEGLHIGHVEGYTASDIISRYYRANGFNVLHPMGWDAFGLPAENYAIKKKTIPQIVVKKNIANFKKQINSLGFSYDWDREVNTTDPDYYKWTQWIFIKLFEAGLAYEKEMPVNWCPSCKTVLADEEAESGKCERCGSAVERRNIKQWMLKITDYADKLLEDLDDLDWPQKVKLMQKNWIGRSEGATIRFKLRSAKTKIESEISVYTTRPDTIFGSTYLVIAPDHKIINNLKSQIENIEEVQKYINETSKKSEQDRISDINNKTGVKIVGITAINPATKKEIPVYLADYVLSGYATGSIMAVPAHDARDYDFAKKFNLPIVQVISPDGKDASVVLPYEGDGTLINSGSFNGFNNTKITEKITFHIGGEASVRYKMRDWIFSRQRYWGEPIPLVFCEHCALDIKSGKISRLSKGEVINPGWVPILEKDLPLELPKVKHYEPTGAIESPLAKITKWTRAKCPRCGGVARRETNTMPQWAGSCWYYLRYIDNKNSRKIIDPKKEKDFMPVDVYIGGVEHATLHLLYARFWHKFLYDIKVVNTKEPFKRLINQGLILGPDGEKMSKSRGNVINPDSVINQHGADALRMYEMFMGPLEDAKPWNTDGIVGIVRFLQKVWFFYQKNNFGNLTPNKIDQNLEKKIHQTIKKVSRDIENLSLNTVVSSLMILIKEYEASSVVSKKQAMIFVQLLAPFAPYICEEIWRDVLGNKKSVSYAPWPKFSESVVKEEKVVVVVQVNGKTRGTIFVDRNSTKEIIIDIIKSDSKISKYLSDVVVRKVIFVPDRVINLIY